MKKIIYYTFLVGLLALSACKNDDQNIPLVKTAQYNSKIANDWFSLSLKITKTTAGFTPPVAARAFGYLGIGLYESVVPGMPTYNSLVGKVQGFEYITNIESGKEYNWAISANACMASLMKKMYPNTSQANLNSIDSVYSYYDTALRADVSEDIITRSKQFGESVANDVYNYAKSDGQENAYLTNFPTDYVPPVGNGLWKPTPPAYQRALQPYWGNVRTFLSDDLHNVQPIAPPSFSVLTTSVFYSQALEVYNVTSSLTPEQILIAQFWSDDPGKTATPPGHSVSILLQVLAEKKSNLAVAAEAYGRLCMGLHDAFVSCWRCKYVTNLLRPITYIQENIDPAYNTLLTTPPFPEYVSGHSVQSGTASKILSELFGYSYVITDRTHVGRTDINGAPRTFNSFYDMADESAISRLYGGIHYRAAIEQGILQGRKIGTNIMGIQMKK